jgi:DNA repair photolyase
LPHEVKGLFREWLEAHRPLAAAHVMSRIQALRGGRDNDPRFGSRMRGEGEFAALVAQRFDKARRRLGLDRREDFELDSSHFVPPRADTPQLSLL